MTIRGSDSDWWSYAAGLPSSPVGLFDTAVELLERARLSLLLPALDVGVEGKAQLCDSWHGPMVIPVEGPWEEPKTDLHIDVVIGLWNKSQRPVAVNRLEHAEAAGQGLTEVSSTFSPMALQPGQPTEGRYFYLGPKDQSPLAARAGDRLEMHFRLGRNGRGRRVRFEIHDPPERTSGPSQ